MPERWPANNDILLSAFGKGEEKAFDLYFSRYYATIVLFTYRITRNRDVAEEIVSDAFLKLWDRCETFKTESGLRSFLYTIARNGAIDWWRKEKTKLKSLSSYSATEHLSENDAFKHQVAAETYIHLREAIEKLPPKCRRIFKMLMFDRKNYEQIAGELKISINTVRVQKTRAIGILKSKMTISLILCFLF